MGASEHVAAFVLDVVRSRYRNRPVQLVASSATSNSNKARLKRPAEKGWSFDSFVRSVSVSVFFLKMDVVDTKLEVFFPNYI